MRTLYTFFKTSYLNWRSTVLSLSLQLVLPIKGNQASPIIFVNNFAKRNYYANVNGVTTRNIMGLLSINYTQYKTQHSVILLSCYVLFLVTQNVVTLSAIMVNVEMLFGANVNNA